MEIVVRASAVVAVALMVVAIVMESIKRGFLRSGRAKLDRGFTERGLAMELAQSPAEVELILAGKGGDENEANREVMRSLQAADFVFIAAYWLLFTLAAVLLTERRFPFSTLVAVAATILATIAAVCDVWEDIFILKITRSVLDATAQPLIDRCRTAALWKWNLLFLALILLSSLFLARSDWRTATGIALAIPGLLIAAAGVCGLVTVPSGAAVENAMKLIRRGCRR
jgi:hypothetical protein